MMSTFLFMSKEVIWAQLFWKMAIKNSYFITERWFAFVASFLISKTTIFSLTVQRSEGPWVCVPFKATGAVQGSRTRGPCLRERARGLCLKHGPSGAVQESRTQGPCLGERARGPLVVLLFARSVLLFAREAFAKWCLSDNIMFLTYIHKE